jgi:predicted amidophosphoribosyltransferase
MNITRALFFLREFFFPSGCAVCGAALVNPEEAWYGLCQGCREKLVPVAGKRCEACGRPLISEEGRCLSCRLGETWHFDRVVLIFPYAGIYRKVLGAYKFGKNLGLGHFFAEKIRDVLETRENSPPDQAVVVPVPPRPGKIRRTGWDQIEHLMKLLERGKGMANVRTGTSAPAGDGVYPGPPVYRCLRRLASRNQKELNRENRMINLKGKIMLNGQAPREAIIIDDVFTTGATLDACAAVLKAGGAQKVSGICLFYD